VIAMAKRPPEPLPLDDPRWCATREPVEVRLKQTGIMQLAITDLEYAMASGKLTSMRRHGATGARELLAPSFWRTHRIDFSSDVLTIYRAREDEPRRWDAFAAFGAGTVRVDGHAFYVWRPGLDKPHGDATAAAPRAKRETGGRPPSLTPAQIAEGIGLLRDHSRMTVEAARAALRQAGIDSSDSTLYKNIVKPAYRKRKRSRS